MPKQGDEISHNEQVQNREADRRLDWERPTVHCIVAGGAEAAGLPGNDGTFAFS
jgi:hypothetical protein